MSEQHTSHERPLPHQRALYAGVTIVMRRRCRGPGPKKKGERSHSRRIRKTVRQAGSPDLTCCCPLHVDEIRKELANIAYFARVSKSTSLVKVRKLLASILRRTRPRVPSHVSKRVETTKEQVSKKSKNTVKHRTPKHKKIPSRRNPVAFVKATEEDLVCLMKGAPHKIPHRPDLTWRDGQSLSVAVRGTMFEPDSLVAKRELNPWAYPIIPSRGSIDMKALHNQYVRDNKRYEPIVEYGKTLFTDDDSAKPIPGVDATFYENLVSAAPKGAKVPESADEVDLLDLALFKLDAPDTEEPASIPPGQPCPKPGFYDTLEGSSMTDDLKAWLR